jgi:hypothetical protein
MARWLLGHGKRLPIGILAAFGLILSGCSETDAPGNGGSGTLTVQSGAASFGETPESSDFETDSAITAMASSGGDVFVGTTDGIYKVSSTGLYAMDLYWETGEPSETGAVKAMAARADGVLIAAENGIFHTYQWAVLASPLTGTLADLDIIALSLTGSGENETVFVAAANGFYRVTNSSMDHITIGDESGGPTALAAAGNTVLVAYGAKVYEFNNGNNTYTEAPSGIGNVLSMATDGSAVAIATDGGLTTRDSKGSYVRYSLADSGSGEAVDAVALDNGGRSVGLIAAGLVSVAGASVSGLAGTAAPTASRQVAVDGWGNVWVSEGTTIVGWMVGTPVSFAESIETIFSTRCNYCHVDGSGGPKHDFSNYDEVIALSDPILERVSIGQMPADAPLEDDQFKLIIQWYAGGQNP